MGGPIKGRVQKVPKALNRNCTVVHALETNSQGNRKIISAGLLGNFSIRNAQKIELSFWVHSPRSLDNLLIEPDVPKLDMILRTTAQVRCEINGKELDNDDTLTYPGIPMNKGWNSVVVKISGHKTRDSLKIVFRSTRRKFMRKLKSLAER